MKADMRTYEDCIDVLADDDFMCAQEDDSWRGAVFLVAVLYGVSPAEVERDAEDAAER